MRFATLIVNVLDRDGEETGRSVPVHIGYTEQVDKSYGANADGCGGVMTVEQIVTDVFTDARLLAEEKTQVLKDGECEFLRHAGRY